MQVRDDADEDDLEDVLDFFSDDVVVVIIVGVDKDDIDDDDDAVDTDEGNSVRLCRRRRKCAEREFP